MSAYTVGSCQKNSTKGQSHDAQNIVQDIAAVKYYQTDIMSIAYWQLITINNQIISLETTEINSVSFRNIVFYSPQSHL